MNSEWQSHVSDSTLVIDTTLPGVKLQRTASCAKVQCCTPATLAVALSRGVPYVQLHYAEPTQEFAAMLSEIQKFLLAHRTAFVVVRVTCEPSHTVPAYQSCLHGLDKVIYNEGDSMLNLWTAYMGDVRGSVAVYVDGMLGFNAQAVFHTMDRITTWSLCALAKVFEEELRDSDRPMCIANLWLTLPVAPPPLPPRGMAHLLWGCLPQWVRPHPRYEPEWEVQRAVDPARLVPYTSGPPLDIQAMLFPHANTDPLCIKHVLERNFGRDVWDKHKISYL